MSKYAIYKYVFEKSSESRNCFVEEGDNTFERSQKILQSMLQSKKLNIYKTKKDGEVIIYPNDVFKSYGGVTVMKVCNVKYITKCKDYQTLKDESNPWCNVVIDNRPRVCQIAIEQTGAFDSDTDKVSNLLRETFGRQLSDYGIAIDIMSKMRTAKFWDFVNEQCTKYHDSIARVVVDVMNPKMAGPIDVARQISDKLMYMSSLVCSLGAIKGSLRFDASKNSSLQLLQREEDFANIVAACCNNGFDITVHFRKMGVYKCNDRVKMLYEMKENVTGDFIHGETFMEGNSDKGTFELMQWLDEKRELTKDYEDAKIEPKRRKDKDKETFQKKSAI